MCIGIIEVLAYLHDNCLDRNAWEIAEKAIDQLHDLTTRMQIKKASISSASELEKSLASDLKPIMVE